MFFSAGLIAFSQNVVPDISARVDTSKTAKKEIYKLYTNYINSKPDSLYSNPYWLESKNINYHTEVLRDRSARHMFGNVASAQYLEYYKPTIIQMDSVKVNRYQLKTRWV